MPVNHARTPWRGGGLGADGPALAPGDGACGQDRGFSADAVHDLLDEVVRVVLEVGIRAHAHRVEERERLELGRELFRRGHHRVPDEDGDEQLLLLEGFPQLGAHRVVGRRESFRVPVRTDQRDHRVHGLERLPDDRTEVGPGPDRVDVVEDVPVAEHATELVLEPSGKERVVGPAIGHEHLDRGHARLAFCAFRPGEGNAARDS